MRREAAELLQSQGDLVQEIGLGLRDRVGQLVLAQDAGVLAPAKALSLAALLPVLQFTHRIRGAVLPVDQLVTRSNSRLARLFKPPCQVGSARGPWASKARMCNLLGREQPGVRGTRLADPGGRPLDACPGRPAGPTRGRQASPGLVPEHDGPRSPLPSARRDPPQTTARPSYAQPTSWGEGGTTTTDAPGARAVGGATSIRQAHCRA